MNCHELLANMSCYIDGDGSPEVRKAIRAHLVECAKCSVVVETTERMLSMVEEVQPFEVPLSVSAKLYGRIGELLAS